MRTQPDYVVTLANPTHLLRLLSSQQAWKWGGCSADINHGMKFSRKFLDVREVEGDTRSAMNLQNNRVGRKVRIYGIISWRNTYLTYPPMLLSFQLVKHLLRTDCKCHGVSGSCAMKTCWRTLPQFRVVGDTLMRKYNKARLVEHSEPYSEKDKSRLVYKRRDAGGGSVLHSKKSGQTPKRLELVYIHHSPNYCDEDLSQGSLGTVGRQCHRNRTRLEGCDLLCCGRGYNTYQIKKVSQCNCKFHWCCNVVCEECVERSEQYTCK